MTPEMAFECLLVSNDPAVLGTMNSILHDFSISTNVCQTSVRMEKRLAEGSTDLIVIDLDAIHSFELLQQVRESRIGRKATVLALAGDDRVVPGVHVILRKPVTAESGAKSVKVAYTRMLQDFRKHTRFALMRSVFATDEQGTKFWLTVTNIGAGGVGLTTKEQLPIGTVLSFRVALPGLGTVINVRARVLWSRQYGVAGGEFVQMPAFDLLVLHAWLESRYRIKRPLVTLE
jgi:hypothetical protein